MRTELMPARGNLAVECARVIRLRIEDGEWHSVLPGERSLAATLEVGRDTVRLALQQLERTAVLSPSEGGCKRRILLAPGPQVQPATRALRIGMLSPRRLEQLSQPMLFEVDHLRRALAAKGGALDLFAPSWYGQKDPTRCLARLMAEEPCNAWILFRSSTQIQRWFAKSQIPCLVRGYPQANIGLSHLDVDWQATARHAAARLWRLGHRRVGILIPPDALPGIAAAVKGASELGEADFTLIEMPENGSTDGVIQALSRALKLTQPPTAVITTRPRQVATALTWLASKGIHVPAQVSLVTLAHDPFLDNLVPEISGYRVDPEAVSKQVIRRIEALVTGNPSSGKHAWITPEVAKGASLAPRPLRATALPWAAL
ncbi:MAG: substrate-binding domain-containing protein [Verrucomicrobiota bacterium]